MKTFLLFTLYSAIGFVLETVFSLINERKVVNRKTMVFLPLCPVYGIGALSVIGFVSFVGDHPLTVFTCGIILASAVEYCFSLAVDKSFQVLVWDYGDCPGSVHGRIQIQFSLMWGYLSLALVEYIHPLVLEFSELVPDYCVFALLLVFAVDCVATLELLRAIGKGAEIRNVCPVLKRCHSSSENGL